MIGYLSIPTRDGDRTLTWDTTDEASIAEVRTKFDELIQTGYFGYKVSEARDFQGEQIRSFDPDAERIVLMRQIQGG